MKIDPSILKPKLAAVSQHVAHGGACITTTINPVHQPQAPPFDPLGFDPDPANFSEEHFEDDGSEEEIAREYYMAQVHTFYLP